MSEWQKVKIGDFLDKTSVLGESIENADELQHLGVSNKLGITITDHKKSKDISKHQYIEQNYFAYNPYRINVGSIGLTPENVVGLVSPAYVVFKTKEHLLLPELLLDFLKSSDGLFQINKLARGTVRKALRFSELCDVEMVIPPIENQQKILKIKQSLQKEIDLLSGEISNQKTYLTQLRQAILQEAIEGKLTADWRVKNPVQKGNPDHDAQALLETIKAEKQKLMADGKIKKEKPLAPINPDDVPFALPVGWVWVRLDGLINPQRALTYGIVKMGNEPKSGGVKALRCSDVRFRFIDNSKIRCVSEKISEQFSRTVLAGDEILLNVRGTLGGCAITDKNHVGFNIAREVSLIVLMNTKLNRHILNVLTSPFFNRVIEDNLRGIAYKGLNLNLLSNFLIPLPPLAEQNAIVERVDRLLESVNALELQVQERKSYAQQLMQAVLKEAFAG